MKPLNDFDVTVVGAGPAGSTAAKLLSDAGVRVALLDKATFPRHKTCASWINRFVFERFPYLQDHISELVDVPFFGIRFFNSDLSRHNLARHRKPSGYLTLRSKFDNRLKNIAVDSGATFFEGAAFERLTDTESGLEVVASNGLRLWTKILIGADGVNSRVAEVSEIRHGWLPRQICMCANEDIPYDADQIAKFYGRHFPINAMLRFEDIDGYGWLFPKKDHICVGIGARLRPDEDIRELFTRFLERLRQQGWVPHDLKSEKALYAIDPAGAANQMHTLVRGRVLLIGDAAGFVSGSTGEGIYPAMMSAEVASAVILKALRSDNLKKELQRFDEAWKSSFGSYIKSLPGGESRASTLRRMEWIFKSNLVCRIAARVFLFGKSPDWRAAWQSLWD